MRTLSLFRCLPATASLSLVLLSTPWFPCSAATVVAADDSGGHTWVSIENDGYEQKAHFISGIKYLSGRLDEQIVVLKAKRSGMVNDTKDWDMAMKEVDDSRALLSARISDLPKVTTPEAWTDAKEKTGAAWKRSQQAVDKMNQTVTS